MDFSTAIKQDMVICSGSIEMVWVECEEENTKGREVVKRRNTKVSTGQAPGLLGTTTAGLLSEVTKVGMGVHRGKYKGVCHGEDIMERKGCQLREAKRENPQG